MVPDVHLILEENKSQRAEKKFAFYNLAETFSLWSHVTPPYKNF